MLPTYFQVFYREKGRKDYERRHQNSFISSFFFSFYQGKRCKSSCLFSCTDQQTSAIVIFLFHIEPSRTAWFFSRVWFHTWINLYFLIASCLVLRAGRARLARLLCCVGSLNEYQTASIFSKQPHLHAANAGGGRGRRGDRAQSLLLHILLSSPFINYLISEWN